MKRIFLITAIVSMFIAPLKGFAQEEPHVDMNTTVEREVTPDEIYLSITIDESTNDKPVDIEVPIEWV